jgi:hypothetical protein
MEVELMYCPDWRYGDPDEWARKEPDVLNKRLRRKHESNRHNDLDTVLSVSVGSEW